MNTEPIIDESVTPPKPRRKDYEDKRLYNVEYNRWRSKYNTEYKNRESQRRYERRNNPVIVERYRQNRLKKYADNVQLYRKKRLKTTTPVYTVYEISNTITDYKYIGYTSQNLSERLRAHKNQSKKGNSKFHHFIKSIGDNVNFMDVFSITALVENIQTKEEALRLEGEFIQDRISNNINLFNQIIPNGKRQKFTNNIILYKILNNITDDIYIGVTSNKLSDRFTSHKSASFSPKSKSTMYLYT